MRPSRRVVALLLALTAGCGGATGGALSDVRVENVALQMPEIASQPARVVFDIGWDVSFRDELNWDAAWVFVKYRAPGEGWRHAHLSTAPNDHRVDVNNGVVASIEPSGDGMGVFLYQANPGFSVIDWDQVSLAWDIAGDGVARDATVEVEVLALPMVWVPEGSFSIGDGTTVRALLSAQLTSGSTTFPFSITSEDAVTLGGGADGSIGNHDRTVSSATPQQFWDDFSASSTQMLPAEFPKGYRGFYVMKTELTQGDYARFLNLIDNSQRATRNPATEIPAGEEHRYAISASEPFRVAPFNRAVNWLSWMDLAAYADWSGLRPMTEFEFEKVARGEQDPVAGEFAWGTEAPPAGKYSLQDPDTGEELVVNQSEGANVAFEGTIGLSSAISGPLRAGAFVPLATSRLGFGGSYYRVSELSGNVAEMVVTAGRSAGRQYRGAHGDGVLSPAGNAGGEEVEFWPGSRRSARGGYEVRTADGSGTRGGDWASEIRRLQISDRETANIPADRRDMRWGGRLVRSGR